MVKNSGLVDEGLEAVNGSFYIIPELSLKDEQNHHIVQPRLEPSSSGIQEQ
jgi:hypothetical protein